VSALLGALLLFLVGLLGARFSFTWAQHPLGPRTFFMAGSHFLLLGVVLGSDVLGLLTPAVLQPLYPLLALGVGWIGLLYGLQLDFRHLRDIPRAVLVIALLQAVIAFLVFALGAFAALRLTGQLTAGAAGAVLAAAALACISSPLGIAVVANLTRLRGRLSELLLFIASLDALVGILALQLVYTSFHPLAARGQDLPWAGAEWLLVALALSVAFAIMFLWLTRPAPQRGELMLFLMGTAVFVAGAGFYLGVSPLFMATLAGVVIANLSPVQPRLFRLLQRWEQPLYVVLLVVTGALLDLERWVVVPLALGYTLLRLFAKFSGGWLAVRFLPPAQRPPPAFGLALASQSGMPLALLLSITMGYGALRLQAPPTIELLVGSVVLAILLGELGGPVLTRAVLRRASQAGGE
jgi:Kef-type K+ transport system membrane component KefB